MNFLKMLCVAACCILIAEGIHAQADGPRFATLTISGAENEYTAAEAGVGFDRVAQVQAVYLTYDVATSLTTTVAIVSGVWTNTIETFSNDADRFDAYAPTAPMFLTVGDILRLTPGDTNVTGSARIWLF